MLALGRPLELSSSLVLFRSAERALRGSSPTGVHGSPSSTTRLQLTAGHRRRPATLQPLRRPTCRSRPAFADSTPLPSSPPGSGGGGAGRCSPDGAISQGGLMGRRESGQVQEDAVMPVWRVCGAYERCLMLGNCMTDRKMMLMRDRLWFKVQTPTGFSNGGGERGSTLSILGPMPKDPHTEKGPRRHSIHQTPSQAYNGASQD